MEKMLYSLTQKKHNLFCRRGNDAILKALKIGKSLGYDTVFIADQGGWLTYRHFPKRLGLKLIEIKSDYGTVDEASISKIKGSIVLLNASPGYFCFQPMDKIKKLCTDNRNLLIEDITATIGRHSYGDILVCSFAEHKPVDYGRLGMISFDDENWLKSNIRVDFDKDLLRRKLATIDERRDAWARMADQIKQDLAGHRILNKESKGINVIVLYRGQHEKEDIINYCKSRDLIFVECPKYYKVLADAISVEVKSKLF